MCHHHQYLAQSFLSTPDGNSVPIKQPLLTPTPHPAPATIHLFLVCGFACSGCQGQGAVLRVQYFHRELRFSSLSPKDRMWALLGLDLSGLTKPPA